MRSSIFGTSRVVATSFLVWVSTAGSVWAGDALGPAAARCRQTIGALGHAFVLSELTDLGRCTAATLACVETTPDDAECLASARGRCARTLARVARRETKLARTVTKRCAALDVDVLLGEGGLGFARLAPLCPALASGRGDATVLGTCLAGLEGCRAERLFGAAAPRAAELLRASGVEASARATLACLADGGGSGQGVRDPALGVAITRCVRGSSRASARLASRTLVNVGRCARALRACDAVPAEASSQGGDGTVAACRADAAATCAAASNRIADGRHAFGRTLATVCGADAVDFAALAAPTGAGLGALVDACEAVGVGVDGTTNFAECAARREECELADLLRALDPEIDALTANGGVDLGRPYCAAPTPTATATTTSTATPEPTTTPTATMTGPTRTPRPGETATPTPPATPTVTRTPSPAPTATPFCGNGVIDDDEECDGDNLDDNTCDDLCFEVGDNPILRCAADCTFDFSGCHGTDCEAP